MSLSHGRARTCPNLRRYRLVLIDESHNLRNREGKTLQRHPGLHPRKREQVHPAVRHALQQDLPRPGQPAPALLPETSRPGHPARGILAARTIGETEFIRRHQCPVRSLAAFEKSEYADDWRELMRLFMVRRTRSFIQDNYADTDCLKCGSAVHPRQIKCPDCGRRRPRRPQIPHSRTARGPTSPRASQDGQVQDGDKDPDDQYARLYATTVVDTINQLTCPATAWATTSSQSRTSRPPGGGRR